VTLSIANHDASLPVAYRLYLPKEWASDRKRRRKVGVPDEISFKTKPEIALAQIRWACEAGLPRGAVLMDAGYGVTLICARASRIGLELCRRHPVTHDRMGTWHRAASAKEVVGSWATTEAAAPR
jgi:FOG: Transposase